MHGENWIKMILYQGIHASRFQNSVSVYKNASLMLWIKSYVYSQQVELSSRSNPYLSRQRVCFPSLCTLDGFASVPWLLRTSSARRYLYTKGLWASVLTKRKCSKILGNFNASVDSFNLISSSRNRRQTWSLRKYQISPKHYGGCHSQSQKNAHFRPKNWPSNNGRCLRTISFRASFRSRSWCR